MNYKIRDARTGELIGMRETYGEACALASAKSDVINAPVHVDSYDNSTLITFYPTLNIGKVGC